MVERSMDYVSLGCCTLAFVLYINTLGAGFVYDDRRDTTTTRGTVSGKSFSFPPSESYTPAKGYGFLTLGPGQTERARDNRTKGKESDRKSDFIDRYPGPGQFWLLIPIRERDSSRGSRKQPTRVGVGGEGNDHPFWR
uniref:Uncharacterized protein n=1 Tax=Anopheles farauti TaxID=69004 RepID=A0A182Q2E3_9DIPT